MQLTNLVALVKQHIRSALGVKGGGGRVEGAIPDIQNQGFGSGGTKLTKFKSDCLNDSAIGKLLNCGDIHTSRGSTHLAPGRPRHPPTPGGSSPS